MTTTIQDLEMEGVSTCCGAKVYLPGRCGSCKDNCGIEQEGTDIVCAHENQTTEVTHDGFRDQYVRYCEDCAATLPQPEPLDPSDLMKANREV